MSIVLKVKIMGDRASESQLKTLMFPRTMSVLDATIQIREKVPQGGQDMSLFRPQEVDLPTPIEIVDTKKDKKKRDKKKKEEEDEEEKFCTGVWLKPNRTLESYDLGGDEIIYFCKRHKVIKVKTTDEATKAVIVDLMLPVKSVVEAIGEKFNLEHTEEYSLQFENTNRWLRSNAPITEQGSPDDVMVLKKRFYVQDSQLDRNSPVQLHLTYIQGRETVVSGMQPTSKEEAALFAALQAQVEFGIFNPNTHKPGFLNLPRYVAPDKLKIKDMEQAILTQWKGLGTMNMLDAKYKYHQLCMTLRTYGSTIYKVARVVAVKGKKPIITPLNLGFTATEIQELSEDYHDVLKAHRYGHLRKWNFSDNDITLDFGEFDKGGPTTYQTTKGEEIATLIAGYIDILVHTAKKLGDEKEVAGVIAEIQEKAQAKNRVAVGVSLGASGQITGVETIAQIQSLNDLEQAFRTTTVPPVKDVMASAGAITLTYDQLLQQMESHVGKIGNISEHVVESAAVHNKQELANLSKDMGISITNLIQDAYRAIVLAKDPAHKQRILDSCQNVLTCLTKLTSGSIAYEQDTTDANKRSANLAQRNLEHAVQRIMASLRCDVVDPDETSLLLELAKQVSYSVSDLCSAAHQHVVTSPQAAANPQTLVAMGELTKACTSSQIMCSELEESLDALGLYVGDKSTRALIEAQLKAIKPKSSEVMTTAAMATGDMIQAQSSLSAPLKAVDQDASTLRDMMDCFSVHEMEAGKVDFLRSCFVAIRDGTLAFHQAQNTAEVIRLHGDIRPHIPVIISYARRIAEDPNAKADGARMLQYARQVTIAFNTLGKLVETLQNPQTAATYNPALAQKSAVAIVEGIKAMIGPDEIAMHKIALLDRSKRSAAAALRAASAARAAAKKAGDMDAGQRQRLLEAAAAANSAVQALLKSIKVTMGAEGDDRRNVNELALKAAGFSQEITQSILSSQDFAAPEFQEPRMNLISQVQELYAETQEYRIVGRLAEIELAVEPFRAAEAMLTAIMFAHDAGKFIKGGTREEALNSLPPASAAFGNALKGIAAAAKAGQPFVDQLNELAKATHTIVVAARDLICNSRFKHERTLLVDATRQLAINVNRIVEVMRACASGETNYLEPLAAAISGSVTSLQKVIALAQKEGGTLVLDDGDFGGPQYDLEIETQADAHLAEAHSTIQTKYMVLEDVLASLPPADDPRGVANVAIIESVMALVQSTAIVVGAAGDAQSELVANLKNATTRYLYARDPALAKGLLTASRHLLASIEDLTRGLNKDTIATLSQQELATHASAVSNAVEILASAVRAGTKVGGGMLVEAVKAVGDATNALLEAAKMIDDLPDDAEADEEDFGIDAYTMQEIKCQMKIVELERKLQYAKRKYEQLEKCSTAGSSWNTVA